MSLDALLVFCIKQHWPWHKVTTVGFYQLASVSLHCSSDFNPLTYNEVFCDMIALQYIEENCMNAVHSGHTQTLMLAIPPHEDTHTHTSTHSIQMLCQTVKTCVMNEGGSHRDSSMTDMNEWLWVTDSHWLTDSSQRKNVGKWKSPFTGIRFILCGHV